MYFAICWWHFTNSTVGYISPAVTKYLWTGTGMVGHVPECKKKSTCICIGPRFNANCCNIVTRDGRELAWTNVVRYLGIFFIYSASCFRCSLDNAKRSFYRSFNGIFGRVGRIASNEVIVQLVKSKCFQVLFYGLEACSLRKYQYKSIK